MSIHKAKLLKRQYFEIYFGFELEKLANRKSLCKIGKNRFSYYQDWL